MSDGMAFLTGAAVAGVAVLFMMRGGNGLGVVGLPANQPPQISPTNPYSQYPYNNNFPSPTPTAPASPGNESGLVTMDSLRAMVDKQRAETEQLKAQVQKQQAIIENLTGQTDGSVPSQIAAAPPPNGNPQQNSIISGLVWGLGGMAVTISGGVVVVGLLAVMSRQQRPARTTVVMPHPYNSMTHSLPPRRRTEVMSPDLEERQIDYVEYER
ncbi:MAG TPA: hypothetical protein DEG17_02910 [Cyanobacteria bacterium UBA11149]|nr:hypothetical protein [Cyanobacteria bacterium UBA11367]HBE59821.1 hypothetical protein [Cyanobacteria bacterium UBA11366]HBK65186.1 hypothetical protein [Cyanobacteria bacterium UBA11166]HBR76914.1 hypothetical protein [Cyanobacteria bacterium UBA11159]HBS69258.1 hypothetical protein [Cyanobacteria bacterium UBA11153]HBW87856.1 hypothetical protein [Cyanobacteria bacterium UBA11149]HCA96307.1 hypothetical protein [Cyanobacteria bacterium UBA9226]